MYSVLKKAGETDPTGPFFQPFSPEEWDSYPFAGEEKLQWFRDAKLGLFFHVGLSSLGKADISWSRYTHKFPDPGNGYIPDNVYDSWAEKINMEDFNAEEWISLARKGGFRYVVIITKHHDGFHMWDTEYSDYKITNAPMQRDYLGELVNACHKFDMPVGLYYSQRDWHHPDYEPVDIADSTPIGDVPFYRMNAEKPVHSGSHHHNYIRYMHNTVRELMEKYGKIDLLWWDSAWFGGMYQEFMWDTLAIERQVRDLHPHILINNRGGVPGDFDTPEGQVGFVQRGRAWETCMPLGHHWAWTGEGIKSFREILHQFIQTVVGDGNYLLSIGAMPNGKIAPEETERILALGSWLEKYGHTIYSTRSGPWNPGSYGGSVYRGDTVYLHLLNIPENGVLRLPLTQYRVKETEILTDEKVELKISDGYLNIFFSERDFEDIIVRIRMEEPLTVSDEGITV